MGCKNCCRNPFLACWRRSRRVQNCTRFTCLSPWSFISCWFNVRKSKLQKNVEMECMHGESPAVQVEPGYHRKETTFNLGVGFGLIHLMALGKCELNKMVELRKQIETLLLDFRRELQNQQNGILCTPSEANITISCSTTKAQQHDIEELSLVEFPSSFEMENLDITYGCGQNNNCNINETVKDLNIDQLEAELEAELENLQLQLDREVMPKNPNQRSTEIIVEDSAPEESLSTTSREVFEQPQISNMELEYNGVHPIELERRLHELLELRQQEKIIELESALESAIHKLHENEREISWWKDTARIVFGHIPPCYGSVSSA